MGLIVWFSFELLVLIPLWTICAKVGFPRILSLATLIPVIGFLIVLAVLAFGSWPNARKATV